MKALSSTVFFVLLFLHAHAGWINVASGINDDFSSVCFYNPSTGFITGKKGIYATTSGGMNAGSWTRITSYLSPNDSLIYNHCQFNGSSYNNSFSGIYFSGNDTVANQGVLFSFNMLNGKLHLEYTAAPGQMLSDVELTGYGGFAVGNNGFLLQFSSSGSTMPIATPVTVDFNKLSSAGPVLLIAADQYLINADMSQSVPAFTTRYQPNRNFRAYMYSYSASQYLAASEQYASFSFNYVEDHHYYADTLSANALCAGSSNHFVATANGIYRTYNYSSILEHQPSSLGYDLSDIQRIGFTPTLFSVGKSGAILYSTDSGGTPEPWAVVNAPGGCVGAIVGISATGGSITDCEWTIDGIYQGYSCGGTTYSSAVPGAHTVRYVFANDAFSDTICQTFHIVTVPVHTYAFGISDTLLCHSQAIDLSLSGSENFVQYTLLKTGLPAYGNVVGTGGPVVLHSSLLNEAGLYHIGASSTLAACSSDFPSFNIGVEHTKADFHSSLINAEPGENVHFDQLCKEAQNYAWTFEHTPALVTSSAADVTNNFSDPGQASVKLVAWSNNGCYDSIVKNGPFIYTEESVTGLCYNSATYNPDTSASGRHYTIAETKALADGGYILAGYCDSSTFHSHFGTDYSVVNAGAYIAKYSNSGTLKWIVQINNDNPGNYLPTTVTDLLEDPSGAIYLSVYNSFSVFDSSHLVDNSGDTLYIPHSAILKLDEQGSLIWDRQTSPVDFYEMGKFLSLSLDNSGNIYTAMNGDVQTEIYTNGAIVGTVPASGIAPDVYNYRYSILKISPTGDLETNLYVNLAGSNGIDERSTPRFLFDSDNNPYLKGNFELGLQVYSPDAELLTGWRLQESYSPHFYIVKFDAAGNFNWRTFGLHQENGNMERGAMASNYAAIDSHDNVYITGEINFFVNLEPSVVVNADSSTVAFPGVGYFLAKVDTSGMCEWVNGTDQPFFGSGQSILFDGDTARVFASLSSESSYSNADTILFTGTDGASVLIDNWGDQVFVASYAPDGKIIEVVESGVSEQPFDNSTNSGGMEQLSDGSYLWGINWQNVLGDTLGADDIYFTDTLFNHPVEPISAMGVTTRFYFTCGIQNYPEYLTQIHDTVCAGSVYTFSDGITQTISDTTIHIHSYTAANGYDSIVRSVILPVPHVSPEVLIANFGFYTSTSGTAYQWLSCDSSMESIPLATENSYYPVQSGNYALAVDNSGCVDTSSCQFIYLGYETDTTDVTCLGDLYTFPDGHTAIIDSAVSYAYILTAQNGWDSTIVTLVSPLIVGPMVIASNAGVLSTPTTENWYEWVLCGPQPIAIPNEYTNFFSPTTSGSYAVVGHFGACTDTSDCIEITVNTAGLDDLSTSQLKVYPNPVTKTFTIEFPKASDESTYVIENMLGEILDEGHLTGQTTSVNIEKLATGMYQLVIDGIYATKIDKR